MVEYLYADGQTNKACYYSRCVSTDDKSLNDVDDIMGGKSEETAKPDVPEQGVVEVYGEEGDSCEHDEFFHYSKGKSFGCEVAEPFVKEWKSVLQHICITIYETLHAYDLFQIVEDEQQREGKGKGRHHFMYYLTIYNLQLQFIRKAQVLFK